MRSSLIRRRVHDLLFGLGWVAALFVFDVYNALGKLGRALDKVQPDPGVAFVVQREIAIFALQMAGAYLLLGLLAGGLIALWQQATGGRDPWLQRWFVAGLGTLWMNVRGTVLWPRAYLDYPGGEWIANTLHPDRIDLVFGALAAAWVLGHAVTWRTHPAWLLSLGLALTGATWLDDHPPAAKAQQNAGPNVVLIGIDALRPDHMGWFGYERDTTPALDTFLDEATVFPDAFTVQARTWPSWMTLLTGAYPDVHGQRDSLPAPGGERPSVGMLTDALQEAGVHTRFLTDDSRFSYMVPAHGFDAIDQPPVGIRAFAASRYQPWFRAFFHWLNGPIGWAIVPAYRYNQAFGATWKPEYFAEHVADAIAEASQHERFFLAAHLCSLHTPADRPWPYHQMYGQEAFDTTNRWRYRSTGSKLADDEDAEEIDAAELEARERRDAAQNLNLYDSGLAMVDLTWARISEALDAGGLWENTLVIVLSDHGEEFYSGDARYRFRGPNHGFHPWGVGQSRVLLALRGAGFDAGERPELASLIDVAPTIARHLELDLPDAEGLPLQETLPDRVLFGETGISESTYWSEGHVGYPFERKGHSYTVDPATTVVYQLPEYEQATNDAKDRWALDRELWLVEEAMVDGPRYSLYRWREDPFLRDDISDQASTDLSRLIHALRSR